MRPVSTIGLDIAKSVFQVHGVDATGEVLVRRQLKRRLRSEVLSEAATMPDWHPLEREVLWKRHSMLAIA